MSFASYDCDRCNSSAHSPTFPSLHLRHNSFSNLSVTSPTPQLILQPFFRFSYVTSSSLNSPGEPPMASILNFENSVFTKPLKALRDVYGVFTTVREYTSKPRGKRPYRFSVRTAEILEYHTSIIALNLDSFVFVSTLRQK